MTLWEDEKANYYPEIDLFEKEKSNAINKEWLDDLALHTQIVIKDSPLCYQHGRILYAALCSYLDSAERIDQNVTIFETGTARGFSSIVMAKALSDKKALGKILTFDVLPHRAPIYWNCIDDLNGPQSRIELLGAWRDLVEKYILFVEGDSMLTMHSIQAERIHFAFLDGAHSFTDVAHEFALVAQHQRAGDIVVFDDYNHEDFSGLVRAVDEGCEKFCYEKRIISAGASRRYVVAVMES